MNNSFLVYAKNSPDALATLDYDGRIRFANQTFNGLFMGGQENGGSYRLNDLEISSPLKSYLKKSIESACLKKEEEQFRCDAVIDGARKHFICRVIPCSEAGEEKKILIELRDNSEAVKLKNELLAGRLTRC
ncbi:MAG: PAS domain-containing protein, partial [Thermodesulfovibrionia bacterium]|nr:PAS domain-containing protein [Thermodesulfovibrionia bacterium]